MTDYLLRATAANGGIRIVAVTTTESTSQARERHSLSYLTTALLGRAITGGLLLASSMKVSHGRVNLRITSDGPLKGLTVDAGKDGTVRGYVGNPNLEMDLVEDDYGHSYFDFRRAIGTGYLHVVRDQGYGEPFTSTVELVNGSIGEDIASYLLHSEQTQSAVFVGEKINSHGLVCTGGLLVQILPKPSMQDELISTLVSSCSSLNNFSDKLLTHKDNLSDLIYDLFRDLNPTILKGSQTNDKVCFKCNCNRAKSLSALKLLGKEELLDILEKEGKTELKCHFCSNIFRVNSDDLEKLIS